MHEQIHNRKELKAYRKELRQNLTSAEATLWNSLKNKKLDGRKFRRQHSVGEYILDFYCPSEQLAIELDGEHHFAPEGITYDQDRTEYLKSLGIKEIRFENEKVFNELESVLETIRQSYAKK